MNVGITGGSGFLGEHLINHYTELGYHVLSLGRSKPNIESIKHVNFDLSAPINIKDELVGLDCIIHCAMLPYYHGNDLNSSQYISRNVDSTLELMYQAYHAKVSRFIFISSIKVNGLFTTENHKFKYNDEHAPFDTYGRAKSILETRILSLGLELGMDVVIIRPPIIYGPKVKGNIRKLLWLSKSWLPHPFGRIDSNRRSIVSIDNLISLITVCLVHPKAPNNVFLVRDKDDLSTNELIEKISRFLGKSSFCIYIPIALFKLFGVLLGKEKIVGKMTDSLQVDMKHTEVTIGWVPEFSTDYSIKKMVDDFK